MIPQLKSLEVTFMGSMEPLKVFFEGLYLNLDSSLRLASERPNKVNVIESSEDSQNLV